MAKASESFLPDWFSHPGETLNEALRWNNMNAQELAEQANWNLDSTLSLLYGWTKIDNKIALKLSTFLGPSPDFWLKRQADFEQDLNRCIKSIPNNEANSFLSTLPVKEMKKHGWIPDDSDELGNALQFFDVRNPDEWSKKYEEDRSVVSFRQSNAFKTNPMSTLIWLRQAERASSIIHCEPWDKSRFTANLANIRNLTQCKNPSVFFPALVELCAKSGVALVFVRAPKGCLASGATKFVTPDKAMIVLSFRYLSDDHFWFTFFHEAAHLILHDKAALFLEDDSDTTEDEEKEANDFSANILIPEKDRIELESLPARSKPVIRFAVRAGISPGIVVGQLQHRKIIGHHQLNKLKRRFTWSQLLESC